MKNYREISLIPLIVSRQQSKNTANPRLSKSEAGRRRPGYLYENKHYKHKTQTQLTGYTEVLCDEKDQEVKDVAWVTISPQR